MSQTKSTPSVLNAAAVALLGAALAVGGCQSDPGQERSGKAVTGLRETRKELADASKQVNEAMAAADAVQAAPADLKPAYEKFRKEVAETESAAADARKRAEDMNERAETYQKKWHEEMAKVTNPDLKAAAESRASKVRGRYATISAKAQDVRAAYQPFIKDLKELQTYLSNDLTAPAVQAAKPAFDKAKSSGQVLNQKLAALQQELDDVASEMSPAPAKN